MDPEAVLNRTRRRFHRRQYHVDGPNAMWHYDGHDKLSRYGFPIHGCVDDASRQFIWLEVVPNNRLKRAVLELYLKAVVELGAMPLRNRSDGGSENASSATAQMAA